jgi:iron only hydrogenase large subunit-like protein
VACPGGCIGGGGQPRSKDKDALRKRQASLYKLDAGEKIRSSHLNPVIDNLYDKYLVEPGSAEAKKLLHTRLQPGGAPRIE